MLWLTSQNIVNYLADERQSIDAALSFFDELDQKSQQYSRQPAMGSPRNELLIGLRSKKATLFTTAR